MAYVWIFIACYVAVFIIINIRMSAQTSLAKSHIRSLGGSDEQFVAHMRTEVPLSKELLVRAWAPLIYCLRISGSGLVLQHPASVPSNQ